MFLVNVPIVVWDSIGAFALVPDSKNPTAERPDPLGAVLSIAGLGLLLWAIIEAPTRGWTVGVRGRGRLASLLVLGGFIAWESHSQPPDAEAQVLRERRFSIAAAGESLGIFGLFGALFELTQFLQFDLGLSPFQAGLRILPMAGVLIVVAATSPLLVRVIGNKFTIAAGLGAAVGGLWQISTAFGHAATYGDVVPGLLLIGVGAGLLMPTATNSVVGSVPQGDAGVGSATNVVAIQVGGALGVAVIGSLLSTRYQNHLRSSLGVRPVPTTVLHTILGSLGGALAVAKSLSGATGELLAHAARAVFISGMNVSLLVGAMVGFGGVVLVLVLMPSRPLPQQSAVNTVSAGQDDQQRSARDVAPEEEASVASAAGIAADR